MAAKKAIRLILLVSLLSAMVPAVPIATGAPAQDYPVCTADYSQDSPRIDGDRVIWVDGRNRPLGGSWNSDIYMYDFATGEESQLTTTTVEQYDAEISGDWVVYVEHDGTYGNSSIKAVNVVTMETRDVWVGHYGWSQRPKIDGDIIVWEYAAAMPGDFDVLGYDLSTDTNFTIASSGARFPVIGGGKVIYTSGGWWAYDLASSTTTQLVNVPGGVSVTCTEADDQHWVFIASPDGADHLYAMDLATSLVETLTTSITPYGAGDYHVDVDGDTVVYSAEPPGPYFRSYAYSFSSGTDQLISDFDSDQYQPHVSNGTIVWRDMRNYPGTGDNYYDIYTNRYIPGAVPVTTAKGIPTDWVNSDVEVTLEVTPTASTIYYDQYGWGTETYSGPIHFGTFQGINSLEYWAQNSFGEEVHHTAEIKIDKSAPETGVSMNHPSVPYVGSASITLKPSDTYSGVGATYWRIDYGTWRRGTTINSTTVGLHTIQFFSEDNARNVEEIKGSTFTITPNVAPVFTPVQAGDRYGTSVEISKDAFPDGIPGNDYLGYKTCVLATGENWPDALGASSLAGALGGPVLLTKTASLPSAVGAEVQRLGATRVIIIGSESAVSRAVRNAIAATPGVARVDRIDGADRYQTATKVASATVDALGTLYDGSAFVSTGLNFPDALGAAPIAAHKGWPVYLMGGRTDATVAAAMDAHGVEKVHILGSIAAVPDSVKTTIKAGTGLSDAAFIRLEGADRYGTAAAVAQYGVDYCNMRWDGVALATGAAFPDALSGGLMQGRFGSVLLLTSPTTLSTAAEGKLTTNKAVIDEVRYLGSESAVSEAVRTKVQSIID